MWQTQIPPDGFGFDISIIKNMSQNTKNRQSIIYSLLPERSERLLDVGCGPINPSYPYADKATYVTCVDWKLQAN